MKRFAIAAALIIALATAPAFSETLPPAIVLDWIAAHLDGCKSYSPDLTEGKEPAAKEEHSLIYKTTVNGFPALVADIGALPISCGYAGSAGSPLAVFVRTGNAWAAAFDSGIAVQDHLWLRLDGKDGLFLWLHGSYCGGLGIDVCWSLMEFDGHAFVEIDRHKNYDCPEGPIGRFGPAEVCQSWLQPEPLPTREPHSSDPPPDIIVAPKEMRDAWEKKRNGKGSNGAPSKTV